MNRYLRIRISEFSEAMTDEEVIDAWFLVLEKLNITEVEMIVETFNDAGILVSRTERRSAE